MLGFLRKHQKYFYFIITIVIVISFSFFGTYQTLAGNSIHEQVAFTAIDGTAVSRADLEEFALFLSTDQDDSRNYGGAIGPNFLNNGVIKKDFLETGLAQILIQAYASDLKNDLMTKHSKEISFKPYSHPEAKFVGSKTVWVYFAPEIPVNLELLQKAKDPLTDDALNAKVALYLAEKRFPPPYLRQILLRQEQQYRWLPHDDALDHQDFSLFGYRNLDDWFGPKFTRLIAEFIVNCAKIAEKKGYHVSKEEALADLMRNAQINYKEHRTKANFNAANAGEYLEQQLVRLRLDRPKAIKIWQQVLLFRRLFHDVGSAVFVDRNFYDLFNAFGNKTAKGELYRIPSNLRLADFQALKRFETYLDAIAKRSKEEKNRIELPKQLLSIDEISKRNPELVQKHYVLELAEVNAKALQSRVTVKEMLSWESEAANWKKLQETFPDIGVKTATNGEERLNALDTLDAITRSRLDHFARKSIAELHPEWIEQALEKAPLKQENVAIRLKGETPAFKGLQKGADLFALLDKATIDKQEEFLSKISFDKENYYRIRVLERSPQLELVAFGDQTNAILDELLERKLEPYYVQIRTSHPNRFQKEDKSWRPFLEVRDLVAELYFEPLLNAIQKHNASTPNLTKDQAAALRFFALAEETRQVLEKKPANADAYVRSSKEMKTLADQLKMEKSEVAIKRQEDTGLPNQPEFFELAQSGISKVFGTPNGDIYFFRLNEITSGDRNDQNLDEQITRARFLLSSEAEQKLLYQLLPELKAKHAISFNYLNLDNTSLEPELPSVPAES